MLTFGDRIISTMIYMLLFSFTIAANAVAVSIVGNGHMVVWFSIVLAIWAGVSLVLGTLIAFAKENGSPMFFDIIASWLITNIVGVGLCGAVSPIIKECYKNSKAGVSITNGDAGTMIAIAVGVLILLLISVVCTYLSEKI